MLKALIVFLVVFIAFVLFAIASAPMVFGIVFITATAIGGAIVYATLSALGYLVFKKVTNKKEA